MKLSTTAGVTAGLATYAIPESFLIRGSIVRIKNAKASEICQYIGAIERTNGDYFLDKVADNYTDCREAQAGAFRDYFLAKQNCDTLKNHSRDMILGALLYGLLGFIPALFVGSTTANMLEIN